MPNFLHSAQALMDVYVKSRDFVQLYLGVILLLRS